jgi:Protein kinase domain
MDAAAAGPLSQLAGRALGEYVLLEPLARGAMGVVYRAHDTRQDRLVAVKVLAPGAPESELARRFVQEAAIMARLEHPHILPIYAYGERDGLAYLVTPYVDGGTLQDRLQHAARPGDPAFEANLRLIQQVCAALDCAHSQGVVHRDVKPSNVLLRSADWALLSDFGLARLVEADPRLTRAGVTVGTPEYIAPEQAEGGRGDYRSDLYAVGVMLFQVLTGRLPYNAATPLGVMLDHLQAPIPRPSALCPDLAPAWDTVIARALAKQPDARYRSAAALEAAIGNVQRGVSGGEPTAPPTAAAPSGATTQQMRGPARAPALDGAAPPAAAVPWAAAQAAPPRPPIAAPRGRPTRREPTASSPATRPGAAMFAAIALVAAGIGFLAVAGDPPARAVALGIPPIGLVGVILGAALAFAALLGFLVPWPSDRTWPRQRRWLAVLLALVLAVPLSGVATLFVDAGAQVGGGSYCAGCVAAGLGGLLGGVTLAWSTIGGTPPRR